MNTTPARGLTIVAHSTYGRPRTFRVERGSSTSNAAYRRLATAILRLDVVSLANDLRSQRLGLSLPRAA